MRKGILIPLLILAGLLSVAAAIYFLNKYGTSTGDQNGEDFGSVPSNYPAELASFDVTSQQAVFGIDEVDSDAQTLLLRFIFPLELKDAIVVSTIQCPLEDSWIITVDEETGEFIERSSATQPLQLTAEAGNTLQGICDDQSCTSITSFCELIVTGGVSE